MCYVVRCVRDACRVVRCRDGVWCVHLERILYNLKLTCLTYSSKFQQHFENYRKREYTLLHKSESVF